MPEIHIHLHDPSALAVKVAVEASQPPPKPAQIAGVKVIDSDEGQRIELDPALRNLLVGHGWLPPVDGE